MPEVSKLTQTQRRDAARAAILDAAIQLLAEGGYARMTLADVGERAGYSRSLATHYFGSKPKLAEAIVERIRAESMNDSIHPGAFGVAGVDSDVRATFDRLTAQPSWARAYIIIAHEAATAIPEVRPAIHDQNVAMRQRIAAAIREAIERGEVSASLSAEQASFVIAAMIRGAVWEWFIDPSFDLPACRHAILSSIKSLVV
jgi:AcrR family transcriptional regulator